MKHGLFVNTAKANCSIYESGVMINDALKYSEKVKLDYMTIERADANNTPINHRYDFYVINWHHWSLPISRNTINKLPGKKFSIVLEVDDDDIFPYAHDDWFDAYIVVDPTKEKTKNIYPFPRPLERVGGLKSLLNTKIPVLGSFGLLTGGKRFEEIIENANKMGDVIVRINLPPVTWMGDIGIQQRLVDYATLLKSLAKPKVDVRITHNYMTKPELIRWCSENTINIFPYYRKQPGLAAVTDQAITAGRAIAITSCNTFRHMHPYIPHYPEQSYEELMLSTLDGIKRMQEDWHPFKFRDKFDELLLEQGIL